MKQDTITPRRSNAEKAARVIRVAEKVLAEAYRHATRQELVESQLRVRESLVREMRRRIK